MFVTVSRKRLPAVYQPAQKWLKDRNGRALGFEDMLHYQKIIKILIETDRIKREIELPLE